MNWFTFSLISVFSVSISNILQRVLLKDKHSDSYACGFVFQLICAVIITFFALINGFSMPPVGPIWFNIFFSATLWGGYTIFLFKALQHTEASEVVVFLTSAVFWTILTAVIFLGETFGLQQIFGTGLILLAVLLVSYKKNGLSFHKGTVYLLLAALFSGIAFANDNYALRQVETFSYAAISFSLATLIILFARVSLVPKLNSFLQPSLLIKMLLMCLFYSAFSLAIYLAYKAGGNASQLGPILQSRVILTILLATLLLKERENLLKKLTSAALVTVGVLLVR